MEYVDNCSFSFRFDMINVNLKNRPDWFVAKSPYIGKV